MVVDGRVVEPALEARDDRQQGIAVRIPSGRKVTVVALERLDRLPEEGVARAGVDNALDGLRDDRRLQACRRLRPAQPRTALAEVPVARVPARELLIPEDDVRHEAVARLPREQAAKLLRGALGVEARPGDRVEAGVPEPLKGIRLGRRDAERVGTSVLDGRLRVGREQLPRCCLERHLRLHRGNLPTFEYVPPPWPTSAKTRASGST